MSKARRTQWHPLFADLLRPLLHDYFDVQANVPVGDVPREADLLLLQRINNQPTPFRGLWRHLKPWNILEFKGPTENARQRDLSLLVELGLGIERRLNQERQRQRQKSIPPEQVAFWYIARKIGGRVIDAARDRLGHLEEIETGLWRSQVLQHLVFLVSSETLASEPDCVPLHLLLVRSPEQERELAKLVIEQPHFVEWYGQHLGVLHSDVWQEVRHMASSKKHELKINYDFLAHEVDMDKFIASYDIERLIKIVGVRKFIKQVGVDRLLSQMPPEDLKKLKERLK